MHMVKQEGSLYSDWCGGSEAVWNTEIVLSLDWSIFA